MISALIGILKAVLLVVWNAVCLVVKLVYRILKYLRIRILTLYLLVCALLSIFLPVFGEWIVYFWVGFALCSALTLGSWLYAIRRMFAARPRSAEERPEQKETQEEPKEEAAAPAPTPEHAPPPARYPQYFDVEGAPQYFFAEYADRYELYMRDGDRAVYIRTDYK